MKERPIIFSAPMVRAILAGEKTQTRRVVKLKPWQQIEERDDGAPWPWMYDDDRAGDHWLPCPYGQAGDRLWVRESFCDARQAAAGRVLYRSSGDIACGWKPSIHMPRQFSRITLEVTAVRVERLQEITEADAKDEGAPEMLSVNGGNVQHAMGCYRDGYADLWESLHGPGSWDANPWVWVVEFKRIQSAEGA